MDLARARAIRRCGELWKDIEKKQGGDRKSAEIKRVGAGPFEKTPRQEMADQVGMSQKQVKTAIRVANVPQESPEVDGGEIRVEVSTRRPGRDPKTGNPWNGGEISTRCLWWTAGRSGGDWYQRRGRARGNAVGHRHGLQQHAPGHDIEPPGVLGGGELEAVMAGWEADRK